MNLDQFVAKYNGVHIDEDGYYGAQCWDVSARYAREVVGCPSFPTGSGGAEGLFRIFANPIPNYFDKLPASSAQRGDVAVFPAGFSPPWGHTAVIISRNGNSLQVIEQNGNVPSGKSYITTRYVSSLSGVLRPKKGAEAMKPNRGDVDNILGEVWGRKPNPEDYGYTDQSWHDFVYNLLAAYPWQNRKEAFNEANRQKDRAVAEAGHNLGVAETRSANLQALCDAIGVTRLPDEQKTTENIIAEFKRLQGLGTALTEANSALAGLKLQIDELANRPTQKQLDDLVKSSDEANKRALEAQAELEKYKEKDANDEKEAVNWLTALWRIITRSKE